MGRLPGPDCEARPDAPPARPAVSPAERRRALDPAILELVRALARAAARRDHAAAVAAEGSGDGAEGRDA
jgi:hypothetical protein